MNMLLRTFILTLSVSLTLFLFGRGLATAQSFRDSDHDLDTLVTWMEGDFSSKRQSAVDTAFLNIDLHMKRIWSDRTDGAWFYVEQALADKPEQPYRQRIYQVQRVEEGMFESSVFELPTQTTVVGAWRDTSLLAGLGTADLTRKIGCEVYLQATGKSFIGGTHGTACRSSLDEASYATSEVEIRAQGIMSWDRGWSATDEQVWGATSGGYYFLRD